jgi:GntR family transcriptional regulator, transcriptional repressor for pyruvate dehydrogenase complex
MSEIADRGLEPGDVLPPEREMLAQHQVARGSLREALRFLEIQGVLTIRPGPGGGPVVSSPKPEHLASTFALLLQTSGATFRSIVEARQILEPEMAAKAAERMTDELLEELRAAAREMRDLLRDRDAFFRANNDFHAAIAWGSQNPLFGHLISSLRWITDGTSLGVDYSPRRLGAICTAHDKVIDALASGDPEAAASAMRAHLDEALTYLQRRYPELLNRPLRWDQMAV